MLLIDQIEKCYNINNNDNDNNLSYGNSRSVTANRNGQNGKLYIVL